MDRGEAINIIAQVRLFLINTKPVINDYDSIENKETVMAAILRDIDGFYKGVRDFKRAVDYFLSAYGYDKPVHAAITEIGEIAREIHFGGAFKSVRDFDNRTPEAVLFRIVCGISANVRHYLKFAFVSDAASSVEDDGTPAVEGDASSVEDAGTPTSSDTSSVEDTGTPTSSDTSSVEGTGTPTNSGAASSETMFALSPYGLDTYEARKYFSRAIEKGFMEKTGNGFKWLYGGDKGQIRLGYFCLRVYDHPRPINALEEAFGVKKISSSISSAECQPARRADARKWRDRIDSDIFFD